MKLRTTCYALIGVSSLLACPNLFAAYTVIGTGSLTISAPGFSNTGDQAGPYSITGISVTSGPGPNHGTANPFETFCIGTAVDYVPGQYSYQISSTIQPTGIVGASPGLSYVAWGTAYLYSQFASGVSGFGYNGNINYSDGLSSGEKSEIALNDALQAAIWTLQQQPGYLDNKPFSGNNAGVPNDHNPQSIQFFNGSSGSQAGMTTSEITLMNQFLTDAANAATAAHVTGGDEAEDDGAFGVYALNMYTGNASNPSYVQPQLCIIPEATTMYAGVLLLLPFGITTVRFLRKSRPA